MAENTALLRCPKCGLGNSPSDRKCEALSCRYDLKSDIECLRSIDLSLKGIRRIAIWFLILSILSVLIGFLAASGAFR
jgi:hypothetical protein